MREFRSEKRYQCFLALNLDQKEETIEGKIAWTSFVEQTPVQQSTQLQWPCRSQLGLHSGADSLEHWFSGSLTL